MEFFVGQHNDLWTNDDYINQFRKITTENIIVMGRLTYESMPKTHLLNRIHVVITHYPRLYSRESLNNNVHFTSLEEALNILQKLQKLYKCKIIIIGGATIYDHFLSYCTTLHIINNNIFPIANINKDFHIKNEYFYQELSLKTYILKNQTVKTTRMF
jgi:dihydrofolate reductase